MNQEIHHFQLENGLTLVADPMPWLESAAFSLSVASGCRYDPADRRGLANFACEMVQRGCGERDSRKFIEDLEWLGVDYAAAVSGSHTNFSGAMPATSLDQALGIFADVVRKPQLPENQLEDGRRVCFQEILAIEDDLPQKVMIELKQRRYPDPLGYPATGELAHVQATTHEDIGNFFNTYYRPQETILAIAGNFDWDRLVASIEKSFGDWHTPDLSEQPLSDPRGGNFHIEHDSNQTHIGLAYSSVPYAHDDYFRARAAVGVLSDGMSSRLFTEVREKRGLCYTVHASYHSLKELGSIVCYAGTSADRAQQTLDVMASELFRLGEGVTEGELERFKIQIRSGLVMQQESSRSRASSIGSDWYYLGRARTIDELDRIIQSLTATEINDYLAAHPPRDFNLVTLGQAPLEEPSAISATHTR